MARMATVSAIAATIALLSTLSFASVGFENCTHAFVGGHVPWEPAGAVRICRDGAIAIAYEPSKVDPGFSAYYVTPQDLENYISGRDDWYLDPDLLALGITQAHPDSDVWSEEWNRGHLCPNRLMSFSESTKKATFSMANVAPQAGYFNQHPWNALEKEVFDWITNNYALHVVTGLAYKDRNKPRRGKDNVAIPDYYFKVICDNENNESVGFIGDNNGEGVGTATMHTVDEVAKLYGGFLFPASNCQTSSYNSSWWWTESQLHQMGWVNKIPKAHRR